MKYEFDPHLATASTPPSDWYSDPGFLELEKERVFARTWQLVGRDEQVRNPGDFFTTSITGEPVLVVRTRAGELVALANVCRHRGGPVAAGFGNCSAFRCGYHGWRYGLDGRLVGTPEFDGVEGFRKEDHPLPRYAVSSWMGLVFVNLDPTAAPLEESAGGITERLRAHDPSSFRFALRKEWLIDCNWKVYVDNYLEGYHIPIVHPGLYRELDYDNYKTETSTFFSIQHAPIRNADRLRVNDGDDEAAFFWLFPNLMLNVYPDNFSTNVIVPLSATRTLTIFEWFFRDPERSEVAAKLRDTVAFSDEIQIEDIAICEAVQRGLQSRSYDRGRYSVKRENGVHHFHGLLSKEIGEMK